MDEQVDDFHAASVRLCGSHDAIWINVFESASGQEPCYFLFPEKGNKVFTGPEWCSYIGLKPKAKRRAWQRLIALAESNGQMAVGTTIEEVLKILKGEPTNPTPPTFAAQTSKQHANSQARAKCQPVLESQTESQSELEHGHVLSMTTRHDIQGAAEQASRHRDVGKLTTAETYLPSTATDGVQTNVLRPPHAVQPETQPAVTTVQPTASQDFSAQPAVVAAHDQMCAQHARIVTYLKSTQPRAQPADSTAIQGSMQSQFLADAAARRQPSIARTDKSSAATSNQADRQGSVKARPSKNRYVRVCFSNHDTKVTKYALWSDAGAVLSQQRTDHRQALVMEPKFLLCSDSSYQEVKFPQPVRAVDLIELLEMDPRGTHARHQIKLTQRYRAPSGHCFYPGSSVAQVIATSTVAPAPGTQDDASLSWEGWDEAATDPPVVYTNTGQQEVYVMMYNKSARITVYAHMKLPSEPGPIKPVTLQFTQCDHMLKPVHTGQPLNIRHLAKAAKHHLSRAAGDMMKLACLLQSLTLPSGDTLPPGTPLSRVVSELEGLNSSHEAKDATTDDPSQRADVGDKRNQRDEAAADQPIKVAKCTTQDVADVQGQQALPELVFAGNAISQASADNAWHAIAGLLQRYGCNKDAIHRLSQTRTKWQQPEQGLEHSFALKYAELSAAVELADKEYVIEVLQNAFQLSL